MTGEKVLNRGWEGLNSGRMYPFAADASAVDTEGVVLDADVVVDAAIHPVVGKSDGSWPVPELAYLSPADPVVAIVEAYGRTLEGRMSDDGSVVLWDGGRRSGVLVPGSGWDREARTARRRSFSGLRFAASVCMPVVHGGVLSLSFVSRDGKTDYGTASGPDIRLLCGDDGAVTPVVYYHNGRYRLRFDAVRYSDKIESGIRAVGVAATGDTVFSVSPGAVSESDESDESNDSADAAGLSVADVSCLAFSREDMCAAAHPDAGPAGTATAVDTCGPSDGKCPVVRPSIHDEIVWLYPTRDAGLVSIIAADAVGSGGNPVHVSTVHGSIGANTARISAGMSVRERQDEASRLLGRAPVAGNGIRIGFPGLGGAEWQP